MSEEKWLDLELQKYAQSGIYPFHMPGHKRRRSLFMNDDGNAGVSHPFSLDITEINGFDDLAAPEGMIASLLDEIAAMYGAKLARISVNGSTGGMFASVFASAKRGETILIERGSHRCIYDAAALRGLKVRYIQTRRTTGGWRSAALLEDVENSLNDNEKVAAVIITTPTYEGEISDVQAIAETVHAHGAKLIIDAAHGAHLGFSRRFPVNPISLDADLVVISLHKTLPVMGQASAVLVNNQDLNVSKYINIFNTSSPSYVILASCSNAVRLLKQNGAKLFDDYVRRLDRFYDQAKELTGIRIVPPSAERDMSKIVISPAGMSGGELMSKLRQQYKLELEMAGRGYCLAMTSIADTDAGYARLIDALRDIDSRFCRSGEIYKNTEMKMHIPERIYEMSEIDELPTEKIPLKRAKGRISAGFVCPYPPGIPLLVPGEWIDSEIIDEIRDNISVGIKNTGIDIAGSDMEDNVQIRVLK